MLPNLNEILKIQVYRRCTILQKAAIFCLTGNRKDARNHSAPITFCQDRTILLSGSFTLFLTKF